MFYQFGDVAIGACPKVASTSLHDAAYYQGAKVVSNDDAAKCARRIAFVREPIERLISCFSHFSHLTSRNTGISEFLPDGILLNDSGDWVRFVDYILESKTDHWQPQAEILGGIANELYPFEQVMERWRELFVGALPQLNAWTHIETSDYRAEDLKAYYQADFELREACKWL